MEEGATVEELVAEENGNCCEIGCGREGKGRVIGCGYLERR